MGCDHKNVKTEYKYEALRDLKIRLLTFMNKAQENNYIKMRILKRILPCFTEHQIMVCINEKTDAYSCHKSSLF